MVVPLWQHLNEASIRSRNSVLAKMSTEKRPRRIAALMSMCPARDQHVSEASSSAFGAEPGKDADGVNARAPGFPALVKPARFERQSLVCRPMCSRANEQIRFQWRNYSELGF
jgi:hypothetical protein